MGYPTDDRYLLIKLKKWFSTKYINSESNNNNKMKKKQDCSNSSWSLNKQNDLNLSQRRIGGLKNRYCGIEVVKSELPIGDLNPQLCAPLFWWRATLLALFFLAFQRPGIMAE